MRRHTSDIAYYSVYRPLEDKRLSWPSWLTYSGRLTHISGHPSAAGWAWDRKVRRSKTNVLTTVPLNQPAYISQASETIIAVPPEWSKTWDGQPWNSVTETAAWLWCTSSSTTRSTLPSHPSTACHSLLPEASRIVQPQCSCVAYSDFFPCPTRDWNVLPIDPSTFHTVDAFKSYQSIDSASFLTSSCYPARNVACLVAVCSSVVRGCTYMEEEEDSVDGTLTSFWCELSGARCVVCSTALRCW